VTHSKPLSRRDFLKLSGTASLGLALSACGLVPTATPTATSTLTTTLTPTATATATNTPTSSPTSEVLKRLTLKEIGQNHNVDIGTTLQGNSPYYDKKYIARIISDYSQVFPGTFFVTTREKYPGQDQLAQYIIGSLIIPNRMQLIMHPGFSHVDVPDRMSGFSNDQIIEYMRQTARMYLNYLDLVRQGGGRPPLVQFLTEALFFDNSNRGGRYMETPFRRAFTDPSTSKVKLISGSYLLFIEEARRKDLEAGVDYWPVWSETDMMHPGAHTSYVVSEGRRAKQEIADQLGISYDEVILDIASQHHILIGQKPEGWEFMRGNPTYDSMKDAYRELREGLGGRTRIHCDSLHVLGGQASQDAIIEYLGTAMQVVFDVGRKVIPSILFWEPINRRSPTGEDKHFLDQGLYTANYDYTPAYQQLVDRFS